MTNNTIIFFSNAAKIIMPTTIFLGILLLGYIIRKLFFRILTEKARNFNTHIDDVIINSIKGPLILWFAVVGIYLALDFSDLPPKVVLLLNNIVIAIGLFSVTLVLANIASRLIKIYSVKYENMFPSVSLTHTIARIIILTIGILIIMNRFGYTIAPVLATLGVGGLAVALALQDTLANFFAGFHIVLNKLVRVGDYIKLESGEEGYVVDINWRTTKIRMLANNVILVPNAKLTQSIITNFYYPEKDLAVLVNLGVHYKSDLKEVERITCEVAKEVMQQVVGGIPEFEPFVRYNNFGDSSIQFTVILRGKEFVDQHIIKHEFIKRLHERYKKENITIPFPIRALNLEQEKVV